MQILKWRTTILKNLVTSTTHASFHFTIFSGVNCCKLGKHQSIFMKSLWELHSWYNGGYLNWFAISWSLAYKALFEGKFSYFERHNILEPLKEKLMPGYQFLPTFHCSYSFFNNSIHFNNNKTKLYKLHHITFMDEWLDPLGLLVHTTTVEVGLFEIIVVA